MSKDFEKVDSDMTVIYTSCCMVSCELYLSEEISPSEFEVMVEKDEIILPNLTDNEEDDFGIYVNDGDGNLELIGEVIVKDKEMTESVSVEL